MRQWELMIHRDDMSSFPMIVILLSAGAGIQDLPLTIIDEELKFFSLKAETSHLRLNVKEITDPST